MTRPVALFDLDGTHADNSHRQPFSAAGRKDCSAFFDAQWVSAVGFNVHEYSTYSLRRINASLIYKATGDLRAIQILLGHSNIENTVRYLGVDVDDDPIALAERTEI